jgi:hypothetical protein
MRIEVFKTNVTERDQADKLSEQLHVLLGFFATFDLEDCDKILRVTSVSGEIHAHAVIAVLKNSDFQAEVLPDEVLQA